MNRMIAAVFQQLYERSSYECIVGARHLTYSVIVPVWYFQHFIFTVCFYILLQCPVGYSVTCRVRSGDEAASGGRTDTARIRLCKHHALFGKSFHVGCFIQLIVVCLLCPEGERSVLPSHVIYHKEDDVRTFVHPLCLNGLLCLQTGTNQWYEREGEKYFFVHRLII